MHSANIRKNRKRRGQTLVESALILMVVLVMFIGIIDVGQVLFVHQTLIERTRSALRYAAVQPFDEESVQNMVMYNQPTAQETTYPHNGHTHARTDPGLFGLTYDMITVTREDASSNEDRIVVQITGYPFRFYTPLIAGLYEGRTITGTIPYEGI